MILRTWQVAGWGCFVEPIHIGPLSEGLNIIAGPNEAGKSTLTSAVARGLFDRRSVSGADAFNLQPWGRAVAPHIQIEFVHEGIEYLLEKRFLLEPMARLSRKEDARYVLLSEADAAEETVRDLFNAHLPGKGMTKPEHWGTAQLLFARQGEIGLVKVGSDAETRLRRALGAMAEDETGDRIERRIIAEYQKLFTEKGILIRGKEAPEVVRLAAQRDEIVLRTHSLRRDLIAIEELRTSMEDLHRDGQRLVERRMALDERLKQLNEEERSYATLASKVRELEAAEDSKRNEYEMLEKRAKALASLRDERQKVSQQLESAQSDLPVREQVAGDATGRLAETQERTHVIRKERDGLERLAEELEDARAIAAAVERERELTSQIKRIDLAAGRLEAAREKIAELVAPDKRELSSIRKAVEARNSLRIQLESSEIVLVVEAESPLKVGKRSLAQGQTHEVRGLREVSLRITGVATIKASGPEVADEDFQDAYAKQKSIVLEKTREFGTDDIDRLEHLADVRSEREVTVRELEKEIEAIAGDAEPEGLRLSLERFRAQKSSVLKKRPEWRDQLPVVLELEAQRKASERGFKRRIDDAEQNLDIARNAERVATGNLVACHRSVDDATRALVEIERRAREEEDDGLDDPGRAKARNRAALAWNAARAELEVARRELESVAEDPARARQRTEKEIDSISSAEREAIGKEKIAEGELQEKCRAGTYSALARAEEELAVLETKLGREQARAEGVKRLHDTLRAEREGMIGAMMSPLRCRVEKNLRRIAGPRHQEILFGSNGLPATMRPADVAMEVSLEALSGGTEEQLFFVTRIALAEFLAKGGREVVIFDDPLVSSDLARIARALPILEEAARSLQILIFTCHPEAYAGLTNAERFNIDPIRHTVDRAASSGVRGQLPLPPGIQVVRKSD